MNEQRNFAWLPQSQIEETAKEMLGINITDDDVAEIYGIMEHKLNDALDDVTRDAIEFWHSITK